jgi:hypothetical protein
VVEDLSLVERFGVRKWAKKVTVAEELGGIPVSDPLKEEEVPPAIGADRVNLCRREGLVRELGPRKGEEEARPGIEGSFRAISKWPDIELPLGAMGFAQMSDHDELGIEGL